MTFRHAHARIPVVLIIVRTGLARLGCYTVQRFLPFLPDVIDKYLAAEIQARRVVGPFESPPCPEIHTSCFGVIPKKGKPNS